MLIHFKKPYKGFEELPQDPDKVGWMDKVKGFQVLFVFAVECSIGLKQPTERWLVLAIESVVEIYNGVVFLNEIV